VSLAIRRDFRLLEELKNLYEKHKEEMYKPNPLLEEYVKKGWLGIKTKRGFYQYD